MIYAGLITLREGVEAALIVAIVLSYLTRVGQKGAHRIVLGGVALALLLSIGGAAGLELLMLELPRAAQELVEGLTMLFAVGVLSWMLIWMRRQAMTLGHQLRTQVDQALQQGSALALGLLAFTSVGREGLETVLFLIAGSGRSGESVLYWAAALAGLLGAALIGGVVYSGAARLPLRVFFDVTGVALIVLAGGLLVNGLKELHEGGLVPALGPRLWDTYAILPDNFGLGMFLSTALGYDASPSLGQVVLYGIFVVGALALFFGGRRPARARASMPVALSLALVVLAACSDPASGRQIDVRAGSGGGKMYFSPDSVRVQAGERLVFVVTNMDSVDHEFESDDLDIGEITIPPGATRRVPLTAPSRSGSYEIFCDLPGHREAGMVMHVAVE